MTAFIAAAQVIANQAVASAATTQTAEAALNLASEAARREVTSFVQDFYEKKIFDPFLRFASAEDEDAYRKGEEERQREIKAALALGTPEGDLRAAVLMMEQLDDAEAHGAGDSREFAARKARGQASLDGLRAAMRASGRTVDDPATSAKRAAESDEIIAIAEQRPVRPVSNGVSELEEVAAQLRAAGIIVEATSADGHGVAEHAAATNRSAPRR